MNIDQLKKGSRMKMPVVCFLNPFYENTVVSAHTAIVRNRNT
jgi:hypothetical protein